MIELNTANLDANDNAKQTYIDFVNNEISQYYLLDIEFNGSYLEIRDKNLEIVKKGWVE